MWRYLIFKDYQLTTEQTKRQFVLILSFRILVFYEFGMKSLRSIFWYLFPF